MALLIDLLLLVVEGVAHYPTKNQAIDQQCHFDRIESLFYLNLCANYILKLEYSFNYIYLSISPITRPITSYNCWAGRMDTRITFMFKCFLLGRMMSDLN